MKKILSMMLAATLSVSMLAGCSQQPAAGSAPAAGDAASASASTATPAPVEEKVIVFSGPDEWVRSQLQNEKGGYEKVVAKFEAENPGVKIKLTSEPWGTWGQKLPVMIASGDAPDVFMFNGLDAAAFYNGGYTADLSDMNKSFLDKFYPGALASYKDGNTLMGLPFTTDCRVLWYNKEIFEAAGLDPNAPPKTWDELVDYAKKCAAVTVDGQKVYGFGMDLGLKFPPAASLLCASDAMLFGDDKNPTVNTDTFKKYLQTLIDMKGTYEPDYATLTHENVATLFGQKKVAMVIAGAWVWSLNEGLSEQEWYAMAPTPKMDANAPDGSFAGGWGMAVSSKSKNLPEAKKFLEALYAEETAYMLHTDVPPVTGADAKSELFQNPRAKVFAEQMSNGRQLMPPSAVATEVNNLVWEEVSKAINGKATVDETIAKIESGMKDILK